MTLNPRQSIFVPIEASSSTSVEGAGRTLSKKTEKAIKDAWATLSQLLLDNELLDQKTLSGLMDDDLEAGTGQKGKSGKQATQAGTDPMRQQAEPVTNISDPPASTTVEAALKEGFVAHVQRKTWYTRLKTILESFKRRFEDVHELGEDRLLTNYGSRDRDELANQLIDDISQLMTELHESYPGNAPSDEAQWEAESPYYYLSKSEPEAEGEESVPVNQMKVEFQCAVRSEAETATDTTPYPVPRNRHAISLVLFRVDEASEAIPAVGAGLPMYVPSEIASQITNTVAGLPLDASDDLNRHANTEIAGVMMSAELMDQDFVVHGYLWPKSQPEKVAAILSNKDVMGASMTADAWGHAADVDGRTVFWVDAIDLKGGCLLFADKATYQQTRLIEANHLVPGEKQVGTAIPIAASTPEDSTSTSTPSSEDSPMDPTELQKVVADAVQQQVNTLATSVETLAQNVQDISKCVGTLVEDRNARVQAEQEANAEAEQQQMFAKFKAEMLQELGQKGQPNAVHREVQPVTRSVSLVAQGAAPDVQGGNEALQLQLKMARLDGAISANIQAGRQTTPEHTLLLDQRHQAETQLKQLQQTAA